MAFAGLFKKIIFAKSYLEFGIIINLIWWQEILIDLEKTDVNGFKMPFLLLTKSAVTL